MTAIMHSNERPLVAITEATAIVEHNDYDSGMSDLCKATMRDIKAGNAEGAVAIEYLKRMGRMAYAIQINPIKAST